MVGSVTASWAPLLLCGLLYCLTFMYWWCPAPACLESGEVFPTDSALHAHVSSYHKFEPQWCSDARERGTHFLHDHTVQVAMISLARRPDRWKAAEAHARQVLFKHVPFKQRNAHQPVTCDNKNDPARADSSNHGHARLASHEASTGARKGDCGTSHIDFVMGGGVDAHAYKALFASEGLEAVEASLGCRVYRGWAVCDEYDVANIVSGAAAAGACATVPPAPLPALSGPEGVRLWLEYEKWFSLWSREHARKYCDYFNRHVTLGECGSCLAHFDVTERAALGEEDGVVNYGGVDVCVIFEDDARPTELALPALFSQITALEQRGVEWDLIYLSSTKYDLYDESPAIALYGQLGLEECVLLQASHRKVCAAYALSRQGALKIAKSGFRHCLFPYDDFLPALHSKHPRPDVMALPCVLSAGDFKAFTFPDDAGICCLSEEAAAVSDNNLSPCVIGDHGARVETE